MGREAEYVLHSKTHSIYFRRKPDDTFLYTVTFTWLQHNAVKELGNCKDVKHIEMKWLNNGSMIPKDVNIVEDLAIHPISILMFLLIKSKKEYKYYIRTIRERKIDTHKW